MADIKYDDNALVFTKEQLNISNWTKNMSSFSQFDNVYSDGINTLTYRGGDGYERIYTKITVEKNKDYTINIRFNSPSGFSFGGYSGVTKEQFFVMNRVPTGSSSPYTSLSGIIAYSSNLNNTASSTPKDYLITFNSGNYTELYVVIDFGQMTDGYTRSFVYEIPMETSKYLKWTINKLKNTTGICQMSELYLYDSFGNKISWDSNTVVHAPSKASYPSNEGPEMIIDDDIDTKFCLLNFSIFTSDGMDIIFELPAKLNIFKYSYVTADDSEERDPVSWTLSTSDNGTDWTIISVVEDATITSDRKTETQLFDIINDGKIKLVNQNENSSNGVTSCTLTMNNCTNGNTLILAYAVRNMPDNNITLPEGWTIIGGGTNTTDSSDTKQQLYFAYKKVASETETITLTQTKTSRIYMICSEYTNVNLIKFRKDLANYASGTFTVIGNKSKQTDIMLYGITAAYYTSGRNATCTPDDLTKIQGSSANERLSCWFDNGSGAMSHTFIADSNASTSSTDDVCLECVQLLSVISKYLIQANNTLYTIENSELKILEETELSAKVFQLYGSSDPPTLDILSTFDNPKVYCWSNDVSSTEQLQANMKATPKSQTVITNDIDLSHVSITGIEKVTAEYTGDPHVACSFDGGTTWKLYNGTAWVVLSEADTGMTMETLLAITTESWTEVIEGLDSFKMRFTLATTDDTVTNIVINFTN